MSPRRCEQNAPAKSYLAELVRFLSQVAESLDCVSCCCFRVAVVVK